MSSAVLYIMTQKGFEVLRRLTATYPSVLERVVIGKDSNIENDYSGEIAQHCRSAGVAFDFRGTEPALRGEQYVFAISWRWLIKHPVERLIVFHDSPLPRYRGFAPLVNMLINGESEIGVTALFGASEYDRGHIIAQQTSAVTYPLKIADAIELNNQNYCDLAESIAARIADGEEIVGVPQKEGNATYSIWRDDNDYAIDWSKSAKEIQRLVDAVGSPYLGARCRTSKGQELIIGNVEVVEDVRCEIRDVGKVIFVREGRPTVICGEGLLEITKAWLLTDEGREPFLPMKSFRVRFG
ncbi:methionyl-tRNA formyltransferase [Henriciella barbarensis]|uniref:Methionyl-tRNA formyltransferase n=1 Tax=Henriciella barbarensis TaxID=86342 RepID=A0A399QU35_9PROT|nr:formyltransferase family protein [Henriciella barbarensis]RIJ22280.1 methionyl-tRNA formyltransferase [Henriciella barbarensis]